MSHKTQTPGVKLGASLAHSGRKQPAKRSTSSKCGSRKEVMAPDMLPLQICCFRKIERTCDFGNPDSIGPRFILFLHSSILPLDVEVVAGDSHFQTWLGKKKAPTVFDFSMSRMWKMIWSCEPKTQTAMLP